jgi:hypothetical protein
MNNTNDEHEVKKKKNDDDDEEHGETNNNNSRNVLGKYNTQRPPRPVQSYRRRTNHAQLRPL